MAKGMNQKALGIARKIQAKGIDEDAIMEITGLSQDEIRQLK